MGQKVNPNGLRIGINRDWSSHWYASKKDFAGFVKEDNEIRGYLEPTLDKKDAGLSHIDIERIRKDITITIYTSRPAIVLGTDSADLKAYKAKLVKMLNRDPENIKIAIVEVKNPDLDAVLVAKDIAKQIENRGSSRVVQKKAIQRVMRAGAMGCKTMCKGRVNGAEIARYEEYREGVLSLHTLRQPIDYAYVVAHTTYGCIGVKVWMALPENYKELRDRKPEETGRFSHNRGGNGGGFRRPGFRPAPAPAAKPVAAPAITPAASKDDAGTKGE
ncbi:MAG: 30S ribosomal protein S3 [Bacilli bacterium]|jgi:small subunit ribosomal protein S3|nr:30S ribosomal protein S3 [Bacilli bacterium]